MKSRMWESCLYGSVRGGAGDCLVYSTNRESLIVTVCFSLKDEE